MKNPEPEKRLYQNLENRLNIVYRHADAALDSTSKQCSGIIADGEETQEQKSPYVTPS